jgi:hypothetical protein
MCKTPKPLDCFYTYFDKRRGRHRMHPTCKPCSNAKSRAYSLKNREAVSASKAAYYVQNRDALSAYSRFRNYGVTAEQFDLMITRQNGLCAICATDDPGRGKGWNVDHDHATGAVRGLLCHACNTSLGGFRDDVAILRSAIEYLEGDG